MVGQDGNLVLPKAVVSHPTGLPPQVPVQARRPMPYAALFLDLDGTLVDSEPLHFEAHRRFLAGRGIACTVDDLAGNIGKGDLAFYRALAARQGLGEIDAPAWTQAKTDVLMEIYRTEGLALRPGILGLLARAEAAAIPLAVVTSSERRLCDLSLLVTGLDQRLPLRFCHEDVVRHKPDPEPYLKAAAHLGVDPTACLVLEDSESGIRSGRAAGCRVIGFTGLVPAQRQLAAGAHATVDSADEVDLRRESPASGVRSPGSVESDDGREIHRDQKAQP